MVGAGGRASGGGQGLVWLGLSVLTVGMAVMLPGMSTVVTPAVAATTIPDSVGIGIYFVPAVMVGLLTAVVAVATHPQLGRTSWA